MLKEIDLQNIEVLNVMGNNVDEEYGGVKFLREMDYDNEQTLEAIKDIFNAAKTKESFGEKLNPEDYCIKVKGVLHPSYDPNYDLSKNYFSEEEAAKQAKKPKFFCR